MISLRCNQRQMLAVILMEHFKKRFNLNVKQAATEAGSVVGFNKKTVCSYRNDFFSKMKVILVSSCRGNTSDTVWITMKLSTTRLQRVGSSACICQRGAKHDCTSHFAIRSTTLFSYPTTCNLTSQNVFHSALLCVGSITWVLSQSATRKVFTLTATSEKM